MDMSNVKSIYDYSVGKDVKKIQDSNGNIIWRNNLFLGFDSPWCANYAISVATGMISNEGGERCTYFFHVKPNTTYRYTCKTAGDRFCVYAILTDHDTPPPYKGNKYPYEETESNIRIIKKTNYTDSVVDYTFTTGPDDKMVYIYFALNTRPTEVRIVEV